MNGMELMNSHLGEHFGMCVRMGISSHLMKESLFKLLALGKRSAARLVLKKLRVKDTTEANYKL